MRIKYNKKVLRKMMKEAFNIEELDTFTFDNFSEVKDEFPPSSTLSMRIIELIEYCERHSLMKILIKRLQEERTAKYEEYKESIVTSKSTALIELLSVSRLRLEELTEKQKETLSLTIEIALAGVLGADPGEIEVVEIVSGSIKIIIQIFEELIPTILLKQEQIVEELGFKVKSISLGIYEAKTDETEVVKIDQEVSARKLVEDFVKCAVMVAAGSLDPYKVSDVANSLVWSLRMNNVREGDMIVEASNILAQNLADSMYLDKNVQVDAGRQAPLPDRSYDSPWSEDTLWADDLANDTIRDLILAQSIPGVLSESDPPDENVRGGEGSSY